MLRLKGLAAAIALSLALAAPCAAQIMDYAKFEKAKLVGVAIDGARMRALQMALAWDTGYNRIDNYPLWGSFDESTFVAISNFQSNNTEALGLNGLYDTNGVPSPALIKLALEEDKQQREKHGFKTASAQGITIAYPSTLLPNSQKTATGLRLSGPRWKLSVELKAFPASDGPLESSLDAIKKSLDVPEIVQAKLFKARSGHNPTYFAVAGGSDDKTVLARFIKSADGSARGVVIRWQAGDVSGGLGEFIEAMNTFPVIIGSLQLDADDSASAPAGPSTQDETANLEERRQQCSNAQTGDEIVKACSDVLAASDALLPQTLSETYSSRGWGYYLKGEYDKSIADYNEATIREPDESLPFSGRGYAHFARGENGQALADFDQALRLKPDNTLVKSYRASAALRLGRLQETIDNIDALTNADEATTPDYLNRAIALLELGRNSEAASDLATATEKASDDLNEDPKKNDVSQLYRAFARAYRANSDDALADANAYLVNYPNAPDGLHARGLAYAAKQDYPHALADLTQAITLGRKLFILRQRGDVYLAMGQPDLALADYQAELRQFPTNPLALAGLEKAKQAMVQKFGANMPPASQGSSTATDQATTQAPAKAGKRIALVIGNGSYAKFGTLPNPTRDAAAMAETFRKIGFDDVKLVEDLDNEGFNRALQEFSQKASDADWAVVYYAGHGMEVDNVNYLIPVDAKLEAERDILFQAVPLDRVMAAGEGAKSLHMVILDACRDNPFAGAMAKKDTTRSVTRGLSRVEPDGASLVVYSAKAGQVAQDGDGANSPFVTALVDNLGKPNLEIGMLFRRVRDEVLKATDRQQEPFTYGSLPGDDLFFNPGK